MSNCEITFKSDKRAEKAEHCTALIFVARVWQAGLTFSRESARIRRKNRFPRFQGERKDTGQNCCFQCVHFKFEEVTKVPNPVQILVIIRGKHFPLSLLTLKWMSSGIPDGSFADRDRHLP